MMSASEPTIVELLKAILQSMVGQIPMLFAYVMALILVIVRWREMPRASVLALCGILFGLFLLVAVPFVYGWVARWQNSDGKSIVELQSLFTIVSVAGSFAHAISFSFLFMAIYAGRCRAGAPSTF